MSKILIADEEKWYMEAVLDRIDSEFGLGRYDYVFNGYDALKMIEKNNYNMIILDMMIPLGGDLELPENDPNMMYGIFILKKIKALDSNLPVVCYTILEDNVIKNQIEELHSMHLGKLNANSYEKLFKEIRKNLKDS